MNTLIYIVQHLFDVISNILIWQPHIEGLISASGAELIPGAASIIGSVLQYISGNDQADAISNGIKKQTDFGKWIYNQDTAKDIAAANYLTPYLPVLPLGKDYFGDKVIDDYYDKSLQNLNYTTNQAVGDTAQQAGALAASRGFANPSAFISSQTQSARNQYVPSFGQLESQRAGSLVQNKQNLYNADVQKQLQEWLARYNLVHDNGVPDNGVPGNGRGPKGNPGPKGNRGPGDNGPRR